MKADRRTLRDPIDASLAGALASALRAAELGAGERKSLRERIMRRVLDPAPAGTFTIRAHEGEWRRISDLVYAKTLRQDLANNNQTLLYRLDAGAEFPEHEHQQEEECFVLAGEIEIGDHRLRQGDMHIAAPGARHARLVSRRGALLIVRSEIPSDGAIL